MPKRLNFHVVYATSEDSLHPACELNAQGPGGRGWRSARLAPPPHELLLRLSGAAAVHKLQLLAHHQLVPSSVEVLVSGGLTGEGVATPCGALYTSVGKVALAPPLPAARTRELRSAALPAPTVARFVKLKLSAPHAPAAENDQVSLMAVNVLGEEEEERKTGESRPSDSYSPYDDLAFVMYVDNDVADIIRQLDARKKCAVAEERFEYARRLKSASTALTTVGHRIGRWRLRKRMAAAREDFELARLMRDRISDAVEGIGEDEELGKLLEVEGADPMNDSSMLEEYDFSHHLAAVADPAAPGGDMQSPQPPVDDGVAQHATDKLIEETKYTEETSKLTINDKQISLEISSREIQPKVAPEQIVEKEKLEVRRDDKEERRKSVHIWEDKPVGIHTIEIVDKTDSPVPITNLDLRRLDEDRKGTDSPRRSITPNSANGNVARRRNKSAGPRSTFEAYEERLLPALRHSHTNEYLRDCGREEEGSSAAGSAAGGATGCGHARPPHKLNERERKQAALPILIFGYPVVEKFYSKTYLDKEEGLNRLKSELTTPATVSSKTSPNKTARAAAVLLQRILRDKVFSVYSLATEIVKILFLDFIPDRVCSAETGRCLERLVPELLRAAGDPAPRVHSSAQHTLLTLADCAHVRSLHTIPQQLVRPVPASTHPRLALSRLQMLEQLVETHGISTEKNSGLTVRRLAECGAAAAQHAAGSVRAAAERILLAAYERSPRVVRAQLPPDDAVTRRNLIYRHLFQQFDRIDTQKMLNKAATEETIPDAGDSMIDNISLIQSTHTGISSTHSIDMSSSLMTSFTSGMTKSDSASTLAPSSLGGSCKSSLRKPRSYGRTRESLGYNKLRLDSAGSPKHARSSSDKVRFDDKQSVTLRKTNRHVEYRHSMIHYDHEYNRPTLKERPVTVYDPGDTCGSPVDSPRSRADARSLDRIDSPKKTGDVGVFGNCESPRRKEMQEPALDSPKMVAGLRSLHLEEGCQMDESGYYSPGERTCRSERGGAAGCDSDRNGGGNTPEPLYSSSSTQCPWCSRTVRADGLDAHYWRRCVLLASCQHCKQLVEARALHHHLLAECRLRGDTWSQCEACGAALRGDEGSYHTQCTPAGPEQCKCPYCLHNVPSADSQWLRHLMQCPRNPRGLGSSCT